MMTKKDLIEKLEDVPDDAVILVPNEHEGTCTPVTDVFVDERSAFGSNVQVRLCTMW